MVGHGGSSAGSYLADPTSPIPSHCASIVATSTFIELNFHLCNSKFTCIWSSHLPDCWNRGRLLLVLFGANSVIMVLLGSTVRLRRGIFPELSPWALASLLSCRLWNSNRNYTLFCTNWVDPGSCTHLVDFDVNRDQILTPQESKGLVDFLWTLNLYKK